MSRISVIIPVFNGAKFIRDALTSVCTQTLPPMEVIVADDCSKDNTCEVVTDFARTAPVPIILFSMEKNTGGPYAPASAAFHRTRGDLVCILDADDMFTPDAFATYVEMFNAEQGVSVGLATSDFMTFADGNGETLMSSYFANKAHLLKRIVTDPSPLGVILEYQEAIAIYAVSFAIPFKGMIRREAWAELGGPNLNYLCTCDVDFVWRLISSTGYRVRILNRPLMRVRMSPGSMSSNRILMGKELIQLLRGMLKTVRAPDSVAAIRRRLEKEQFDLAYESYKRRAVQTLIPALCGVAAARLRRFIRPSTS